ncbi:hypothetical protein F9278_18675 [Streptomyces phaeolivaceus]|uniref:P22 coat protein-protein 5 domain protein n=1 Tax=Streptomyces phaeolivaceus TaxID=2653200 RepID=A0A5P8K5J1_9ACTN|nr:hypothetical protein [Streptomyces phaeolivaceus]QFQ97907.1 hypothetical protein F9278_18675 [Streptomyces phaeolivaceus]
MAFQYQHTGTLTFVPEAWASSLLVQFDPLLVWSSRLVSNRDYEGEIRNKGDVVHVNSLIRPTVGEYSLPEGMMAQRPETVDQEIPISQADYLQLLIEDAERVQLATGDFNSPINKQMIRALAAKADTFMGNVIASSATALPNITPSAGTIPASLYGAILDMMLELDESDVPEANRYVVVSPKAKRYLVEHPAIANAAAYGEGGVTANGVVARLSGFTVAATTAMPTGVDIVAGHPDFATFASQFNEPRAGQSEKYRADYVDSLHLCGGKVLRYPGLDTKKADNTWDETLPSKGIVKAAVTWPS